MIVLSTWSQRSQPSESGASLDGQATLACSSVHKLCDCHGGAACPLVGAVRQVELAAGCQTPGVLLLQANAHR